MMNSQGDALLQRLSGLETGQISDVLDEAGLPNHALARSLVPLDGKLRVAGRASCLRGEAILTAKNVAPALASDAFECAAKPGSIVVIATGGFIAGACIGGFVAYSMQREGAVGMLTDGAVRDADEIRGARLSCDCSRNHADQRRATLAACRSRSTSHIAGARGQSGYGVAR